MKAHLGGGKAEECVGLIGQEELQGERAQQEAGVVHLHQARNPPPFVLLPTALHNVQAC